MLVNGDLVRVPQGTVFLNLEGESTMLPLRISTDPAMAIVIENRTPCRDLVKILMGEEVLFVYRKFVQLVGG